MNQQLIPDEGHRNRMTLAELEGRMAAFLTGDYSAVLFEEAGRLLGYALYKQEAEWIYLRQFFVLPENRRSGVGRMAFQWLQSNVWRNWPRVRVEVLTNNPTGIAFWRSIGFTDYCLTMEREQS